MQNKRVLLIQDISCVGRCSLTVALPTLSAMGVQACPLPTALLSSHPLGFTNVVHTQQYDFCAATLKSYAQQGINFDAVLTGYLGEAQMAKVAKQAMMQNGNALKIVDPVLADHGKLYSKSNAQMCEAMCELCTYADIITPNVTESAVILGENPLEESFDNAALANRLKEIMDRYKNLKAAIITGAVLKDGTNVNAFAVKNGCSFLSAGCDDKGACGGGDALNSGMLQIKGDITIKFLPYKAVPQSYPGTGDLFTAVMCGALIKGQGLDSAVAKAANFIYSAADSTLKSGTPYNYGVNFEPLLHLLMQSGK